MYLILKIILFNIFIFLLKYYNVDDMQLISQDIRYEILHIILQNISKFSDENYI